MATPSTAITRTDLSAPFSEFELRANRQGFIAPQILRPRLVGVQAADIGKIPLEALLLSQSTIRAPGGAYKRGDFEFEKYSYATDESGWEEPMDDRTLAVYAGMIDAEEIHASRAMDFVLGEFERDVATAIYNTTTWTGAALTTAITNEWDDAANATPITDIIGARQKIIDGSGLYPNALICNRKQWEYLANVDSIVDRVKYTSEANQGNMRGAVAAVLDVDMILVAGGIKNTANPQATPSLASVWSDEYVMLARVATTDDPGEPCVGRTFIWTGDGPGVPGTDEELALVVEEYRDESVRSTIMRARNDRDVVIMYAAAAHLLSNAIT